MAPKNNVAVEDVAALREVVQHADGYRAWIPTPNDFYKFNSTSVAADDGIEVLRPNNVLGVDAVSPGRWLKIRFAADDVTGIQPEVFEGGVSKVSAMTELNFIGATVVDGGGGRADVTITPGVLDFLDLTDTPANYTSKALDIVRVNAAANALEFVDETSDFLSQYALLAGRSGGQSWIGGLDAGDDVTITATANATPGDVIIKANPSTEIARFLSTGEFLLGTPTLPGSPSGVIARLERNQNSRTAMHVANQSTGVSAFAEFIVSADTGASEVRGSFESLGPLATGAAVNGAEVDSTSLVTTGGANGLILRTFEASPIKFKTNQLQRGVFLSTGEFLVGRTTLFAASSFVEFEKNRNATTALELLNQTSGTLAITALIARHTGARSGQLAITSPAFTPSNGRDADEVSIFADTAVANGIALITQGATPIKFKTNTVLRASFLSTGEFVPASFGSGFIGSNTANWNQINAAEFRGHAGSGDTVPRMSLTLAAGLRFGPGGAGALDTQHARIGVGQMYMDNKLTIGAVAAPAFTLDIRGDAKVLTGFTIGGALDHDGSTYGIFGTAPATQPAHIADPSGGATVDAEARAAIDSINAAMAVLGHTAAA